MKPENSGLIPVHRDTGNRGEGIRNPGLGFSSRHAQRDAWRRLRAALIAVSDRLDVPYEDDPRWTPWTRFVKPAIEDADADIRFMAEQMERLQAWSKYQGDFLLELTDQEPCEYDHHGYCQTHGLSERPCIQERARAWLGCPLPTDQPGLPKALETP